MYNQNSPFKIKIKTLNITLPAGETFVNEEIDLPKGIAVSVAAKPGSVLSKILNLGFYEDSQEVNTPIDISYYRDREIGNHPMDGFMPLNTQGNTKVETRLIAPDGPFANDVNVQVVFLIKQPFPTC